MKIFRGLALLGPKAPAGKESNWMATVPGKGYFAVLRLYGPTEAAMKKTWKPGDLEKMNSSCRIQARNISMRFSHSRFILALLAGYFPAAALADVREDLAKKLSNPVASLISVPFQFNYDDDIGSAKGRKSFVNAQPVVPITLNADWNLISRTIIPIVDQNNIAGQSGSQSGVGDIVQSLFFSPKAPTSGGLIWGAGPVFLLPTASNTLLGGEKWGLGPTGVVLTQRGPWTMGGLANHIWSVGGDSNRADISATFIQPFVSYTTKTATTYGLNTESTYNWKSEKWSVPINLSVSQLMKWGNQPVSLGAGTRYWADSPASGPEGWGFRLTLTFLFPK